MHQLFFSTGAPVLLQAENTLALQLLSNDLQFRRQHHAVHGQVARHPAAQPRLERPLRRADRSFNHRDRLVLVELLQVIAPGGNQGIWKVLVESRNNEMQEIAAHSKEKLYRRNEGRLAAFGQKLEEWNTFPPVGEVDIKLLKLITDDHQPRTALLRHAGEVFWRRLVLAQDNRSSFSAL